MRLGTCFSGIGAPEAAMPEAEHIWCAEIEPAPSAVLAHRVGSPNLGDVLADDFIDRANVHGPLDVLMGGPPCQAFSTAGLRLSMQDARGNLTLRWAQIIHGTKTRNAVTENVPGWLSTRDNAFGCFLAGLVGADAPLLPPDRQWGAMPHFHRGSYNVERTYGWKHIRWPGEGMVEGPRARATWRILDAQYFGVAQRRNRVFVVADFGDGADPAAVLFERKGVRGDSAPRRETGANVAALTANGVGTCGADDNQGQAGHLIEAFGGGNQSGAIDIATAQTAHGVRLDFDSETFIAHSLRGEGFDASEDGTGRGTPIVPVHSFDARQSDVIQYGPLAGPLDTNGHSQAVFSIMPMNSGKDFVARETDVAQPLMAGGPVGGNQGGDYICFTAKDYGADAGDISPTLRDGGHTGSHANGGVMPAVAFASNAETMYGIIHADAPETDTDKALRSLRCAVGEKAFSEWGLGVLAAFQSPEVLQCEVHGEGLRQAPADGNQLVGNPSPRSKPSSSGAVRTLWCAGCIGRSPRRWRPSEQLAIKLVTHLSELPRQGASKARFLLSMWRASEGLGILREALSALQEIRRSAHVQTQSAHSLIGVRRITPKEALKLQGFPPSYFDGVKYRGKPLADGPMYKMTGNSQAVPVVRWILKRIEALL